MNRAPSRQAGAEPRSTQKRFGIPVREFRLRTRILLLRLLSASPLPELSKCLWPAGDLILCLHNVVEHHGPLGVNRGLDITARDLEAIVSYLQAEGYRPVGLDDICLKRETDRRPGEKRVAITFDDGYAGNLNVAYPILRRYSLPFTVYVTTGFMDLDVRVWWYALERLLAAVDRVAFEHAGRMHTYTTVTLVQKIHTYRFIRTLLLQAEPAAADQLLEQLFDGRISNLRELGKDDLLTPEQVGALSRDPLVTIGAHTVSHAVLRTLTDDDSRCEIHACRERLEAVTGASIRHFAYPFGNRAAFGPREERFVRECGYATATTTCARHMTPADRPTALPRIMLSAELDVIAALRVLLTGWFGRRS